MSKEVKFNSKSILDIKFEKDVKGYNALEVDKTLDGVIEDYKIYEEMTSESHDEIAKLLSENENLKKRIRELEVELAKAKSELKAIPNNPSYSQDNLALLKRIDALERALYQKGVNPKKI